MKDSDLSFVAHDSFTRVYPAPTAKPHELKRTGSTFRGMDVKEEAIAYAIQASEFLAQHDIAKDVFVVQGPTSTTKCRFEVVTESSGYRILHRVGPPIRDDSLRIVDTGVDEVHASVISELAAALEGLLNNQIAAWKKCGFSEEQIRAMPYLKPGFNAVAKTKI